MSAQELPRGGGVLSSVSEGGKTLEGAAAGVDFLGSRFSGGCAILAGAAAGGEVFLPEAGEDFALAVARALGVATEAGDEREALLAPLFRMEGPGEADLACLGSAWEGDSSSSSCLQSFQPN